MYIEHKIAYNNKFIIDKDEVTFQLHAYGIKYGQVDTITHKNIYVKYLCRVCAVLCCF